MLIYFSDLIKENPNITTEFSNLFNDSFLLKTNSILGTLSETVQDEYDLILTNPPYVTSGSSNLKEEIKKDKKLESYYKINAMGVEGLFMEWIVRALKPNGKAKAFVIVPDGIFNRQSDKNLRKFIIDECYIDGIISLPPKTFFSTPKKTYILCLTRKTKAKDIQTSPVFTYLVSEIGESRDVYRHDIKQDDLKEAVKLYNSFKGSEDYFIENNTDKRCKIQSFENFNSSDHWNIEKWWMKEEQVKLGIIEKDNYINLKELPDILDDMANTLISLKNDLPTTLAFNCQKYPLEEIFDFKNGDSKLTKTYLENNKGEHIVYSANTKEDGIFGYINRYDYDTECIQMTTNGAYAGTVFYRNKHKFSINGDARLLIKKHSKLDYHYLLYEIKNVFAEHQFNWEDKPTQAKIRDIKISIPVTNTGEFDIDKQKEIALQYKKIEEIKNSIKVELNKIEKVKIDI